MVLSQHHGDKILNVHHGLPHPKSAPLSHVGHLCTIPLVDGMGPTMVMVRDVVVVVDVVVDMEMDVDITCTAKATNTSRVTCITIATRKELSVTG